MPPSTRVIRSVTQLRTRPGAPEQAVLPYKTYMAITVLEMERFRRETEHQSLSIRLQTITTRLRLIDTEKAALLAHLKDLPAPHVGARPGSNPNTLKARPVGGFKFQY